MRDIFCGDEGCILEDPHSNQTGMGYSGNPEIVTTQNIGLAPKEPSYLVPLREAPPETPVRKRRATKVSDHQRRKREQTGGGRHKLLHRRRPPQCRSKGRINKSRTIGTKRSKSVSQRGRRTQVGGGKRHRPVTKRRCVARGK